MLFCTTMLQLSPSISYLKQKVWSVVFITFIVYIASLPLIVFKLKCSTPDCAGELLYEGQEHGLLSNGQHLFTYELLRRFMFHFFDGKVSNWLIRVGLMIILYPYRTTIFTEHSVMATSFKDAGVPNFEKSSATTTFALHGTCFWSWSVLTSISLMGSFAHIVAHSHLFW